MIPKIGTNPTHFQYVQFPLWLSAMAIIRSSVIFLYVRIFPMRWFRFTCYSISILNTIYFVAMLLSFLLDNFVFFTGCRENSQAACETSYALSEVYFPLSLSLNLVLDVVVVTLPVPTLWRLQMPISKKIMLSGMFCLGVM